MNVENLAGNQFVNFAMVASTELPSVFVGEFLINRFGRRWCQVACMTLTTAFFCLAIIVSTIGGFNGVVTGSNPFKFMTFTLYCITCRILQYLYRLVAVHIGQR